MFRFHCWTDVDLLARSLPASLTRRRRPSALLYVSRFGCLHPPRSFAFAKYELTDFVDVRREDDDDDDDDDAFWQDSVPPRDSSVSLLCTIHVQMYCSNEVGNDGNRIVLTPNTLRRDD